jgi:hypothetical protein
MKLINKEKNTEKILEKYLDTREKKLNEEKIKTKRKKEHILKYLKKNEEEQEKFRKLYFDKKMKLEETITNRVMTRDDNNKTKAQKEEKKYKNTVKNRQILEKENDKRKMKMLKKISSIDERLKDKRKKSEKDKIKEREERNARMLERNIIIQRMLRIQDYKNRLKMDELEVKEKKLSEFKLQKEKLAIQRAQASTEVQKQKEEILQKFERLSRQKKEIEPEMIRELFPGDVELYRNVLEMKKKQKEIEENIFKKMDGFDKKNKSMASFYRRNERIETNGEINNKSMNDNNNEKEKKEKEIQKKVEEFKTKEYKEFNLLIMKEKEKEEKRAKAYEEEKDEQKKLEIEKRNKEERELASQNINKNKENIEQRIKEYEENLRKEN